MREEKLKRYRDFWKSKDPSIATEQNEVFIEYYRKKLIMQMQTSVIILKVGNLIWEWFT